MTTCTKELRAELEKKVQAKISETYKLAEKKWGRKFALPSVTYKVRGRVAGYAHFRTNRVDFNLGILIRETERFLARTVPHECAHLIANEVYGDRGHGKGWKAAMALLEVEDASRCHDFAVVPARKSRLFVYACDCREHTVSAIRHGRMQRGQSSYVCNSCAGVVRFVSELKDTEITMKPVDPLS